ncbi:MAG: AAA family ATPase [Candidatus Micrarchaeia archaeon]
MFIDKVVLKNFKSFKNATVTFTPGVDCVIGPNGSGKSNITDALQFAFGDSRLKQLRAKKVGDLISHGSNVAEVTVEFDDNGKKRSVTRKIRADGKMQYRLDDKRVNKYVIDEFLAEKRISLNNFIKQGEVQRIVEMHPKERRELIDVIANVSEYEEKKKEAFAELGRVDQKIGEANVSLHEKEGYLRELKDEKEKAEKWRDTDAALKRVKATLAEIAHADLSREFEALVEKLFAGETAANAAEHKIRELEARITAKNAEKEQASAELNKRALEGGIEAEINALNNAINANKQLIDNKKTEEARLERRKDDERLAMQRAQDELGGAKRRSEELADEAKSLAEIVGKEERELKALLGQADAFSKGFQEARRKASECETEMGRTKDALQKLQGESAILVERKALKERELERLRQGTPEEDYARKESELEAERKQAEREHREKENSQRALFESERKLNEGLPKIEGELLEIREKIVEKESRLKMAGERAGEDTAAARSVKENVKGVHGILQELISYDDEHSLPVTIALGSRLNYLVVDSVKTAGQAVEYLKKNRLGRLSFIPLNKIESRKPSAEDKEHAKAPGAVGFLLDLLEYDSSIARAVEYACGNTLVMKDFASAEPLVRKLRLVTMQGELAEASGLVTGGSAKRTVNVYAEQATLEKLRARLDAAKAEREGVYAELSRVRDALAEARREKSRAELNLKTLELELGQSRKSEAEWTSRNANAKSAANELKKEIKECAEGAAGKDEEKSALIKRLSQLNIDYLSAKEKIDLETESRLGGLARERERKLGELKTAENKARAELEAAEAKSGYAQREFDSAKKRFAEAEGALGECRDAVNKADDEIRAAKGTLAEKQKRYREFSKEFGELMETRNRLEKEIGALANEKGGSQFSLEGLRRESTDLEVQKAHVDERLVEAKARLAEYEGVEPLREKLAKKHEPELSLARKKLEETLAGLGNPNLSAIEKYGQRFRELEEQKQRVTQLGVEKDAVISIINEIEGRKKETFMATFNHINKSFENIFGEIFTGHGSLYLENPDAPFEGGLTIQVELDNKEIRYLELMSGGEKALIALLFLFAVQSANPSSVYVLDESDAALDQENSRKLALLLKALSKNGQFIVVTHNDTVYKNADCLVGVAMQGKQGSRIVEVNVADLKSVGAAHGEHPQDKRD